MAESSLAYGCEAAKTYSYTFLPQACHFLLALQLFVDILPPPCYDALGNPYDGFFGAG